MNNLTYKIDLYDYWSTSSGLSGGALADNLCLKDKNGLPFLPGKTVKGLFREAAGMLQELRHEGISEAFIHHVFGEAERTDEDNEPWKKTQTASSFFTNATFNGATAKAITKELSPHLFEEIATTALESTGLAKKYSLRRTQYALPCTLYGEILNAGAYKGALKDCAAFIKRLGLNRHRGYGRCKIIIL
jgi:CRISPR/Cas system CSM-associated protein Csm3 (group 7 of RAMP superfamily)